MKGRYPDDEMRQVDTAKADVFHVEQLAVPGVDADRCIVWARKVGGERSAPPASPEGS